MPEIKVNVMDVLHRDKERKSRVQKDKGTHQGVLCPVGVVVAVVISPLPCDSEQLALLPQACCDDRGTPLGSHLTVVNILHLH